MLKTLLLNQIQFQFEHKINRRSKRVRLAIYPGGRVTVTTPYGTPDSLINQFIHKKSKWILDKLNYSKKFNPTPIKKDKESFAKHKVEALRLAKTRLEFYNKIYKFKYNRVSVKNHTSLWGSCSKRGNLNFNYRIALLPLTHADYVIVHELCHIKEFNHSKKFWDLLAQTIPNHKQIRADLRKIGLGIA